MEWREEGVLLSVRRHGESAAIIEIFTEAHGRHAGVVRGGASRRMSPVLQPGAQLLATWRARLEDHLGAFTVEPLRARASDVLSDPVALAGLSSVCALLSFSMPERQPHAAMYARTIAVLDGLGADNWASAYLRWELALLDDLGFGLDLSRCAVTGTRDDLAFVSPRSGRAVSRAAAGPWREKLLPLPSGMSGTTALTNEALSQGLSLTGYFLSNRLAPALGDKLVPAARQRLVDRLSRHSS